MTRDHVYCEVIRQPLDRDRLRGYYNYFRKAHRIYVERLNYSRDDPQRVVITAKLTDEFDAFVQGDDQHHQHCSGDWGNYRRRRPSIAEVIRIYR